MDVGAKGMVGQLRKIWVVLAVSTTIVHGATSPVSRPIDRCTFDIDYTRVSVNPRPGHSIEMGSCSPDDTEAAAAVLPFGVELVRVDKAEYSINETFVYTVRVTNESNVTITLPVSGKPIYKSEDGYPAEYRHVYMEFEIQDNAGANAVVDRYTLYGSSAVKESLLRLDPGSCVLLHVPGYMQIYSIAQRNAMLGRATTPVTAKVSIYLFDPKDPLFRRSTPPAVSNRVDFSLRGQEIPIAERRSH